MCLVCHPSKSYIITFISAVPMIQNLEATLKSGGVPQVPQFRPSTVSPLQPPLPNTGKSSGPNSSTEKSVTRQVDNEAKSSDDKSNTVGNTASPSVKPTSATQKPSPNGVTGDPLGDARNQLQDEIVKEFAAIMATGTMRASEAAALATKRVMQRYGQAVVSQS